MKKLISIVLLIVLLGSSGCASVQKKFTRKKKTPSHIPTAIYFHEGPYQKKYSNVYYYKTHFTFWKSWHDELINQLGSNQKKVKRCAQEALGHLTEMSHYLVEEKVEELQPRLDVLAGITKRIENSHVAESEEGGVRVELEKTRRLIANNFYYDKVQGAILPDKVAVGDEPPDTAAGS